jgi:hypothetical protein
VAALLALVPTELARWRYDRAVAAAGAGRTAAAEAELASAVRLDPAFPLYPLRLALLRAGRLQEGAAAADLAWQAAKQGKAVPSLWLVAGILGYSAHRPWAGSALEAACTLDPLDPFPPFYAMLVKPGDADAPALGAQALLAEPRFAAAVFWRRHPDLLARSLAAVRAWPGVDDGWKEAFLGTAASGRGAALQAGGGDRRRGAGDDLAHRLPPPPLADALGPDRGAAAGSGEAPSSPGRRLAGNLGGFFPGFSMPPPTGWAAPAHSVSVSGAECRSPQPLWKSLWERTGERDQSLGIIAS